MSNTGKYDAECWANGKSPDEIKTEIARINSMWEMGPNYQFPGNASYQFSRMQALKELV